MLERNMWNVNNEEETKKVTSEVLKLVANVVAKTFGPYGSDTIVEDPSMNHHMTKDGFTVLRNIRFSDPMRKTISKMIYDIAFSLVVKVGDGSTSSIVSAHNIYCELEEWLNKNKNVRRKLVSDKISEISTMLEKEIYANAKSVDEEFSQIKSIASIATNNDENLGELIANTYRSISKHGKIKLFQSQSEDTYVEIERGFKLMATLADKKLVNDHTTMSNILTEANVLLIHGSLDMENLEEIVPLINHMIQNNEKLVVITNGYGQLASQCITDNILGDNRYMATKLAFIYMPLTSNDDVETFKDLEIFLDAKAVDVRVYGEKFNFDRDYVKSNILGFCDKIESKMGSGDNCILYGGRGVENRADEIQERVKVISSELEIVKREFKESLTENMRVLKLENRLLNFSETGGIAKLYVGGKTPMEKTTDMYLIEDAIKASESAIKYGYNIGCSLIIPLTILKLKCENEYDEVTHELMDVIYRSFMSVMATVLKNKYDISIDEDRAKLEEIMDTCISEEKAFNLITEEYTDTEIINSSRTDVEILKATLSIISLLLLSNQFVSLEPRIEIE